MLELAIVVEIVASGYIKLCCEHLFPKRLEINIRLEMSRTVYYNLFYLKWVANDKQNVCSFFSKQIIGHSVVNRTD